jgi:DNA polymerase-4
LCCGRTPQPGIAWAHLCCGWSPGRARGSGFLLLSRSPSGGALGNANITGNARLPRPGDRPAASSHLPADVAAGDGAGLSQISIDEAFLDVTAREEEAEVLARQLQQTIRQELDLPCSLGVATSKLVAKIANTVGKGAKRGDSPPCAITVVAPGTEAAFLAPLPCDELWGVGPKTAQRLADYGLRTIGELAQRSPQEFEKLLGKIGYEMVIHARGIDNRPVVTEHEQKSISQEITFSRDVGDEAELQRVMHDMSLGVAAELRRSGLCATTVKLKMRWPDFTTPTRQMTLVQPSDDGEQIYAIARQLFARLWQPGQMVRLIGVGVSGLTDQPRQMGLFDAPDPKAEKLTATVSAMRARFGDKAIVRGSDMRRQRAKGATNDNSDKGDK